MAKTIESVLGLMNNWDAKTAEALAAPGHDLERLRKHVAASAPWGACKVRDHLGGDGARDSTVRLTCERGTLVALLSLDPDTRRLKSLDLLPTRAERCVP